jgi:hypothetical protein
MYIGVDNPRTLSADFRGHPRTSAVNVPGQVDKFSTDIFLTTFFQNLNSKIKSFQSLKDVFIQSTATATATNPTRLMTKSGIRLLKNITELDW